MLRAFSALRFRKPFYSTPKYSSPKYSWRCFSTEGSSSSYRIIGGQDYSAPDISEVERKQMMDVWRQRYLAKKEKRRQAKLKRNEKSARAVYTALDREAKKIYQDVEILDFLQTRKDLFMSLPVEPIPPDADPEKLDPKTTLALEELGRLNEKFPNLPANWVEQLPSPDLVNLEPRVVSPEEEEKIQAALKSGDVKPFFDSIPMDDECREYINTSLEGYNSLPKELREKISMHRVLSEENFIPEIVTDAHRHKYLLPPNVSKPKPLIPHYIKTSTTATSASSSSTSTTTTKKKDGKLDSPDVWERKAKEHLMELQKNPNCAPTEEELEEIEKTRLSKKAFKEKKIREGKWTSEDEWNPALNPTMFEKYDGATQEELDNIDNFHDEIYEEELERERRKNEMIEKNIQPKISLKNKIPGLSWEADPYERIPETKERRPSSSERGETIDDDVEGRDYDHDPDEIVREADVIAQRYTVMYEGEAFHTLSLENKKKSLFALQQRLLKQLSVLQKWLSEDEQVFMSRTNEAEIERLANKTRQIASQKIDCRNDDEALGMFEVICYAMRDIQIKLPTSVRAAMLAQLRDSVEAEDDPVTIREMKRMLGHKKTFDTIQKGGLKESGAETQFEVDTEGDSELPKPTPDEHKLTEDFMELMRIEAQMQLEEEEDEKMRVMGPQNRTAMEEIAERKLKRTLKMAFWRTAQEMHLAEKQVDLQKSDHFAGLAPFQIDLNEVDPAEVMKEMDLSPEDQQRFPYVFKELKEEQAEEQRLGEIEAGLSDRDAKTKVPAFLTPEEFEHETKLAKRVAMNLIDPSELGKNLVFDRFPGLHDERTEEAGEDASEPAEMLHLYRLAAVRKYRRMHSQMTEKEKMTEYRPLDKAVEPKIPKEVPEYKRLPKAKMDKLLSEAKTLMDRQGNVTQPKKEDYMRHLKDTLSWLSKNPEKEVSYLPTQYLKSISKNTNDPLFAKIKIKSKLLEKEQQKLEKERKEKEAAKKLATSASTVKVTDNKGKVITDNKGKVITDNKGKVITDNKGKAAGKTAADSKEKPAEGGKKEKDTAKATSTSKAASSPDNKGKAPDNKGKTAADNKGKTTENKAK